MGYRGSSRGPSPWVPLVMVGVLVILVFGSFLQTLLGSFSPLLGLREQLDDREAMFIMLLFLVLFLLLIQMTVNFKTDSFGYDGEGVGMGTVLLLLVFFVLYLIFTSSE